MRSIRRDIGGEGRTCKGGLKGRRDWEHWECDMGVRHGALHVRRGGEYIGHAAHRRAIDGGGVAREAHHLVHVHKHVPQEVLAQDSREVGVVHV